MWWSYKPYVSVAQRAAKAKKKIAQLQAQGREIDPVAVEGRTIARTFWGKAWCDNLSMYSDYDNRMPRGRSYVRNGMVLDLQIQAGRVSAMVQGTDDLYDITIKIKELPADSWKRVKEQCAGQIGSILELMQGKFSDHVMRTVTDRQSGLFPSSDEIKLGCSCPDWAGMCKHVAAVLYGVGARLDRKPELLFVLRGVDPAELIVQATQADSVARATRGRSGKKTLELSEAADVFGIELEAEPPPAPPPAQPSDNLAPSNRKKRTASVKKTSSEAAKQSAPLKKAKRVKKAVRLTKTKK